MTVTTEPTSGVEGAKVVEGSDGLLLEIDGRLVPNYDATLAAFDEGDVVTGRVVRIDNDEVLVDIGYKSEGVIPSHELSIRKSVNPADEVSLGEEVDALVLIKEDQDGRLILSKKRARFERAWRRIEAAAESGDPVEGLVIEVVKGGLIIDLGVRGFLPASLVDIRRVPRYSSRFGTRRMSTSEAGRKPRTPRSMIRPPFTTSMTVPSTGSPDSAAPSMRRHAFSKRARFLDMMRRPSWSSLVRTSASTSSPSSTSSCGSTLLRMESSFAGMTPSDL